MQDLKPSSAEDSHQTKGLLRLTMACNERCPFCNVPAEDYTGRMTPDWLDIASQVASFVASGEQTLTISGGEPTLLRNRLLRLIRLARSQGISLIELQTNAILIDEAYAAQLVSAGLTSAFVSLLSDVPALHDELAGLSGAHARCLRGIDALLDAGVRVTLNPVLAQQTQTRLLDFISFVAARLPRVRSVSLSAVQPHGRAAQNISLVPDYAVLGPQVPLALGLAVQHNIELLNPYCGLPLCVGWDGDLEHCVEAIESRSGGWTHRPGIDNQGNKSHGPPCKRCALQGWCGGAWHAYWTERAGSGIAPPATVVPPWRTGARSHPFQTVIRASKAPSEDTWQALNAAQTPTVWLWTPPLIPEDVQRLQSTRCTDVGLEISAHGMAAMGGESRRIARQIRAVVRTGRRVFLAVPPGGHTPADLHALGTLAATLGVLGVDVLAGE